MAHITSISFEHVDRNFGCTCDKCGQYIQNIWTVKYDNGSIINYGIDCFDNLCKKSKLNDYGMKVMHKGLKRIAKHKEEYEMWKTLTYEEAEAKDVALPDFDDEMNAWYRSSFNEYKEWMLDTWFPTRFREDQMEIDRFKKINFCEG